MLVALLKRLFRRKPVYKEPELLIFARRDVAALLQPSRKETQQ